ncbi:ATP-Hypothetical protein cassette, sub-family C (CFTR MRP), member [Nesidiocoris tenuis]|uniref:ABC transmembrane type-1 domain-containing protein n=1 Tax=Nesidiocoris tenuis TaxID=355587 RepID=A0ABN7AWI3_9HEMI|nr:ATP-Hypothetical protein cassette, sub-family C (CFTR MRP), member [Nesidiocoris tenuis]
MTIKFVEYVFTAASEFFELWLLPILTSHPELSIDKQFPLRGSLQSIYLRQYIEKCWTNELLASIDSNRKPQFLYATWRCYGPAYVIVSAALLVVECSCALQALVFYYYTFDPSPFNITMLWGISLVYVVTKHLWKATVSHMGIQLRVSLQTLLLKKALLIDTGNVNYEELNAKVMRVVRRLAKLDYLFLYTPYITVVFVYTILVAAILVEYYSYSTRTILMTISVLFVIIPCQILLAYKSETTGKQYIRKNVKQTQILDEYRRARNEIKAYDLSGKFMSAVKDERASNRKTLYDLRLYEGILSLVSVSYTKFVTIVYLVAHSFFNEELREENVTLLLAFLEIFMYPLTACLSSSITLSAEFVKTINLLQEVLMMLDRATPNLEKIRKDTDKVIEITDAQAISSPNVTLKCKSLCMKRGETAAFDDNIMPQTKKTLLRLVTGDIDLHEGEAHIYGKVSFCSNEPWLFPRASIKQNILCDHFYNSQRYQKVINVSNLCYDFQFLPKGEKTVVGCKGDVNITRELSIKISIARALYWDAELYVIDGIFDHLPAQTSNSILKKIMLMLTKDNKCVVLFSKRPWLSNQAQRSFCVVGDQIQERDARGEKIENLNEFGSNENEQPEEDVSSEFFSRNRYTDNFRDVRVAWKVTQNSPIPKKISLIDLKLGRKKKNTKRNILPPAWSVMSSPYRTRGTALRLAVMFSIVIGTFISVSLSAGWSYITLYQSILPPVIDSGMLELLMAFFIITSILVVIQQYWLSSKILDIIFNGVVDALFALKHWQNRERETILFILNNLHPQLEVCLTTTVLKSFKGWLFYLVAATVMIIYTPFALIQAIAMSMCLAYIGKYCLGYITKLLHLQDEIWGIVEGYFTFKDEQILSIRSLGSSAKYRALFHEHMDNYTSIQYMAKSAMEGLSFWMGLISVINIGIILAIGLITDYDVYNSIALYFSLALPNVFPLLIEHTMKLLYYLGHVKMSLNYMDKKQIECVKIDTSASTATGSNSGDNEHVESNFVVCKVNSKIIYLHFAAKCGQLIGVLGDGKWAVPSVLYGFCEILSGKLRIGHSNDSLKFGFISHDPHIFDGPLIGSLSWGKQVGEEEMWTAIDKVGLTHELATLPFGLKTSKSNWNETFTHNQRQLLYLAAAIVANTQTIVIHLAPTHCSLREEINVLDKVKKYLSNSTVFLLSNRLRTAMATDSIMVFKDGVLMGFNETSEMVADPASPLNLYINSIKQRSIRKELRDLASRDTPAKLSGNNSD